MTRRRPAEFDLKAAIASVSFTPGERDFDGLVELLGDEDEQLVGSVERSFLRAGAAAAESLRRRVTSAPLSTDALRRARICRLLGRFLAEAGDAAIRDTLIGRLRDDDARTRRYAAGALGKGESEGLESVLLAAFAEEPDLSVRRVLAASLGKVGGVRARAILDAARASTTDAELARILGEAVLRLARKEGAGAATGALDAVAPPAASATSATVATSAMPGGVGAASSSALSVDGKTSLAPTLELVLRCRRGLETILRDEVAEKTRWEPRVVAPGEVRARFSGPLEGLFVMRTALSFGFALPLEEGPLEEAVARALSSTAAWELIEPLSRGGARYRIEWARGGKKRAAVFGIAEAVCKARPGFLNDPSLRNWEAVVFERPGGATLVELRPRLEDPRFTYRLGDVPAASHPTLAAALARLAGADPADVVWDPFAGSGTELCERALLGPYKVLNASDVDAAALVIAETNLKSAGARDVSFCQGDSLELGPPGVNVVITNPPMGRRVLRHEDLAAFFDRFIDHVAAVLPTGGRLVFVSPLGQRTADRGANRGLRLTYQQVVDMGGFDAHLQIFRRA